MLRRTLSSMASVDLKNFSRDGKKIIGAALNYMDIVRARGVEVPKVPLVFLKPTSSYIREGENIVVPKVFTKIEFEVELGFIIKTTCKNVKKENAMDYVGGYCLALDMTAQEELVVAREKGRPWSLGKGFDTSTPVSSLIPKSAIKDVYNLNLWLKVNGKIRQNGNTKDLIFKIPELIEHVSKYMTLEANDLILTGTPGGSSSVVGGDVIECGLEDIAKLTFNVCNE